MRLLISSVLCSALSLAHATTITTGGTSLVNQGLVTSVGGSGTVDFNSLPNGTTASFTSGIATYSNIFVRNSPLSDIAGDSSQFSAPSSTSGDMTIAFATPVVYFGLYWGSPDPTNTITFFNGATQLFSLTGQNLHDQYNVSLGSNNAAYVNFFAGSGESYTRIVVSAAGSFPFETDNHAFATVPEPGSLLLMGAGFGLLFAVRFRVLA
jgi:PEP-CTERM motif